MMNFNKPAKSTEALISEWQQRGLIIDDEIRAKRYLDFIGYYRLSAYTIPFQQSADGTHQFKPNVRFDDVLNLYVFDRELRLLVMDAIERIEVALRSQITNTLSLATNNAFWYLNANSFRQNYEHYRFLSNIEQKLLSEKMKLDRDIKKIQKKSYPSSKEHQLIDNATKENFLRHYISQYDTPKLPPSWMMMELLTWGEMSRLYENLADNSLKKQIAKNLSLTMPVLEAWLKALNSIRNLCAHHSRLWNREFGISIVIPTSQDILWLKIAPQLTNHIKFERRVYAALVMIQVLLYRISPNSTWAKRLQALLLKYPTIPMINMAIPKNWEADDFWVNAL